MTLPWITNMRMMVPGRAPMVLRIAMSACLSVTTMTSIEMMLNAATAMISDRITHMTVFSVRTAWNRLPRSWVQSRTM